MIPRTQRTPAVFRRPFPPKGFAGLQPAGTCVAETEEELLEGLSFPAFRRVSTTLTRRPSRVGALVQALPVDPRDLAEARAADDAAAEGDSAPPLAAAPTRRPAWPPSHPRLRPRERSGRC